MKKLLLITTVLLIFSCSKSNEPDQPDELCECSYSFFEQYSNPDRFMIVLDTPCNKYEVGEKLEENIGFRFVACLDDNPEYCFCMAEGNWTDQTLNEWHGEGNWGEEDRHFTTQINCSGMNPGGIINVGNKVGLFTGCIQFYN